MKASDFGNIRLSNVRVGCVPSYQSINRSCLGVTGDSKMASEGQEEMDGRPRWLVRKIQGILVDITGVLYNSSEDVGEVIPGSVEAIQKYD